MKKLFFLLTFLMIGTFAFANENSENYFSSPTEDIISDSVSSDYSLLLTDNMSYDNLIAIQSYYSAKCKAIAAAIEGVLVVLSSSGTVNLTEEQISAISDGVEAVCDIIEAFTADE